MSAGDPRKRSPGTSFGGPQRKTGCRWSRGRQSVVRRSEGVILQ